MAGVAPYFGSLDMGLLRQKLIGTEFKHADGMESLHASSSEDWNVPISEGNTSSQKEIKEDLKVRMLASTSEVKLIFQGTVEKGDEKGITEQHREQGNDVVEGTAAAGSPFLDDLHEYPFRRLNEKDKEGGVFSFEDVLVKAGCGINFTQVSYITYI
jgi:hypothetical protein